MWIRNIEKNYRGFIFQSSNSIISININKVDNDCRTMCIVRYRYRLSPSIIIHNNNNYQSV